eukprot:scaffold2795_cov428-Pinguiococcus_pyrenoidosus.AAC.3
MARGRRCAGRRLSIRGTRCARRRLADTLLVSGVWSNGRDPGGARPGPAGPLDRYEPSALSVVAERLTHGIDIRATRTARPRGRGASPCLG